jgi:hypothetical protein
VRLARTISWSFAELDLVLGNVGTAIERAQPKRLARLYRELHLDVRYRPTDVGGHATVTVRVANECVRGGTCALTIRLVLG